MGAENKYKYMLFNYDTDYFNILMSDAYRDDRLFVCMGFNCGNRLLDIICHIHNSRAIRKVINLPFKSIWYKKYINYMPPAERENIRMILFYESSRLSTDMEFLKFLRANFKNALLAFSYTNPISHMPLSENRELFDLYDIIFTFEETDFIDNVKVFSSRWLYSRVPIDSSRIQPSDVFFVGENKGRIDKLLDVYSKLSDAGLVCDFTIINVPKEKRKFADKINYEKRMKYQDVLGHVEKTKCILELLQDDQWGVSLRTCEAVTYNKKLLTNNSHIQKAEFYSPENIKMFDGTIGQEDIDFISQKPEALFAQSDYFSKDNFVNHLDEIYDRFKAKKI